MLPTKLCTGCKACGEICGAHCIAYKLNQEGFWYPSIDESRCMKCSRCEQVCPVLHAHSAEVSEELPRAMAVWSRSTEKRAKSSSGGVFGELAEAIINKKGIVCGAVMDDTLRVRHVCAETLSDLEALRGSKYVQSDVEDCYRTVQANLKAGRLALFSGTPCQVEGLKSFLGYDYENLFTVDIICHGVPSPLTWERYLEERRKAQSANVVKAGFRDKTNGWTNFSLSLQFDDGAVYRKTLKEDAFMNAFLANLCLRESCYQCRFKSIRRKSDLTVGDFWGIDRIAPEINDDGGVSLVILQSEKGRRLFREIEEKVNCRDVDCQTAVDLNGAATHSVYRHPFREYFFHKLPRTDFDKQVQDCLFPSYLVRLERKLITR